MAIDLDALVNVAVRDQFAVPTSYEPLVSQPGAPAFGVQGIFDADHKIILDEVASSEMTAAGHSTTMPVVGYRTADLGLAAKQGDRVTIAGAVYQVQDIQPDGDGWVDLILKKRR